MSKPLHWNQVLFMYNKYNSWSPTFTLEQLLVLYLEIGHPLHATLFGPKIKKITFSVPSDCFQPSGPGPCTFGLFPILYICPFPRPLHLAFSTSSTFGLFPILSFTLKHSRELEGFVGARGAQAVVW